MQRLASSTHLRGSGLATLMPRSSRPVRLARRGVAVSVLADGKADSGGFFGFATNTLKSGTQIMRRENGKAGTASKKAGTMRRGNRDGFTVFVAGATGRLGARIVWELLGQGFKVRAGVRSADKAETFLNIVSSYSLLSKEELGRLQVVAFDLEKPDTITSAIGNAGKVVCAVGASESELGDLSAPRRIDGDGATRLVRAATAAGVYQFILITSLGTGKLGFPAGLLNLFGGVLVFKRRAEEALEASGLPYVIVRPGGMERPRDDYKLSHNVKLATRDKLFGGQVSRLQVAELVAAAAANPKLAENKVLEVVAETTAPAYSYENLLAAHPAEVSQEEREAEREAAALLTAQVEEANGQIAASEASLAKIRDTIKAATVQAATLRQQEQAVRKEQSEVLKQAERAEKQLAALRADADKKAVLAAAAKAVVSAAQQAQREGRLLSAQDVAAIKRSVVNPPKPVVEQPKAAKAAAPAAAVGALFGGKRAVQAAEEKEEVEEVQPRKTAGLDLFGSFVRKVEVVAEEEEEEEEEEAPPPKSTFGFGFFGMQPKAVVVEEEQVEEEEEEAPAPPPKRQQQPAFAFFGGKQEVKKDAGEAAAAAAAATAAAQKAADDAATKEAAAAKAAAEQAAAKAAADEATAAKAAEAEAARLKKAREEEAEMLARKAEAAAKRRAEEEAIAARLAEEAAAKKAAEEDVRRAVAKKAVAEAAAKKAAERAAAEKAAAAAATAATPAPKRAGTPANVAEAHAWISNWQAKQQGGQQLEPAVQQLAAASDVVPANVAEARAWIAAWKAKQ